MLRPALASLAFLVPAAPLSAGVLVVDPAGGPGVYTQIQAAVDAALDGDVLLVKSGSYTGFLVNQKSLSIVGDTNAVVTISGGVRVRSLPASGMVLLANLSASGTPDTGNSSFGLWCSDNQGFVRVESCSFTGASSVSYTTNGADAWSGARVVLSPRVSFSGTDLLGGTGAPGWDPSQGHSGAGLEVESSSVSFHDCLLSGGDGHDNVYGQPDASHGGDGCHGLASTLYFSNSAIQGGDGGDGTSVYFVLYALGGDAGDGLDLTGSLARIHGTTCFAGQPGTGFPSGGADGLPGLARRGANGQYLDLTAPAIPALLPTPARESTSPEMQVTGSPGSHVYLLMADAPAFGLALNGVGMRLVHGGQPSPMQFLGDVPALGTLIQRIRLPALPPGVQSATSFIQVLVETTGGLRVYGPSGTLVVLDSSF